MHINTIKECQPKWNFSTLMPKLDCWIHQLSLGVKVHTIPELQLALQTFFGTIYLLARSFFDQRQQTGGMICR